VASTTGRPSWGNVGDPGRRSWRITFVVSANMRRRHLNASQLALIGAEIANMKRGGDRSKPSIEGLADADRLGS